MSELKEPCHICRTSSIVTEVRMLRGQFAGQVFRLCDDCRDSDEVQAVSLTEDELKADTLARIAMAEEDAERRASELIRLAALPEPWIVLTSGRTNAFPTYEQAHEFASKWPGAQGPFRIAIEPMGTREPDAWMVERYNMAGDGWHGLHLHFVKEDAERIASLATYKCRVTPLFASEEEAERRAAAEEGECPICEGSGHQPGADGMNCRRCGGTVRIDDEEEAPEDPIAEPYYPGFNLDSEEWEAGLPSWEDDRL